MAAGPVLLDFTEALQKADATKPRHVLLGNGFSRACRNDIFAYEALFSRADFRAVPRACAVFQALNTTDFEKVMNVLRMASQFIHLYAPERPELIRELMHDADALKEVLATAIAQHHPERPQDIEDERYAACRAFLYHFKSIYTLNYDLLLYWTIMQKEVGQPLAATDDGFRTPDDGEENT